jgi:hypothetical protein
VSNISAIVADGQLSFGVCEAMAVSEIRVSAIAKDSHEMTDIWAVEGQLELPAGQVIEFGQVIPGTRITIAPKPPPVADHYIDIHLVSQSSQGEERVYFGHFDGDELSSDNWLANDGSLRTDAC